MVEKVLKWLRQHPQAELVIALLLIAWAVFFFSKADQWWHGHQVNKQDAQIQKSIDANAAAAEKAQSNADQHASERQSAEGRAQLADEEKQRAADNSNRTIDPVKKARQRYEETRRSTPADSP